MNIESVWDYPRPPRVEPVLLPIRIVHGGEVVAETRNSLRVLETSHPPVYYLPHADFAAAVLRRSQRQDSFCEFKGFATYWDLVLRDGPVLAAAWSYEAPVEKFRSLAGHVAVYASRVDECRVAEELVLAQPGDFYGGWITRNLRGPFKGLPGTLGW